MLLVNSFRPNSNSFNIKNNSLASNAAPKSDGPHFTSTQSKIVGKSREISTHVLDRYSDVLGQNFKIFTAQLNNFLNKGNIKLETSVIDSSKTGLSMMLETVQGSKEHGLGKVSECATAVFLDKQGKFIGSKQLQVTKNAAILQVLDANAQILEEKMGTKLPPELKNKMNRLIQAISVTTTQWRNDIKVIGDCNAKAEALSNIFKKIMPEH